MFFTFRQPCFCESPNNWTRWMFLWNVILFVVVKKGFLFFFWSKSCLAKRIISSATSRIIKLGKLDDEISSNVFTVICVTAPYLIIPMIKPNFFTNWLETSKGLFRSHLKIYGGAFFKSNSRRLTVNYLLKKLLHRSSTGF